MKTFFFFLTDNKDNEERWNQVLHKTKISLNSKAVYSFTITSRREEINSYLNN